MAVMLSSFTLLMFAASLVVPSPMQAFASIVTGLMFLLSILGVRICYKESKEELLLFFKKKK